MDSQSKEDIIKLELELKNIKVLLQELMQNGTSIICKFTKIIYKSILLEKAVCL